MKESDRALAEGMLYTDMYQLTMAQLYFRMGMHERPAMFEYFTRGYPDYGSHRAGYLIFAGLEWLIDWMQSARMTDRDIEALRAHKDRSGEPLFCDDFLVWLRGNGTWEGISIESVPEGRVVHANAPMAVVKGPLAMAQILESPLLNLLNYQTLIASKAARVRDSARGLLLLEFGMRRAQERAASAGARAALIGGADFSSNVGISRALGFPAKGTHAHSMVQVFLALGMGELDAFREFARLYPDDCILLVDTIDTLNSGVPNAIKVFEELRKDGHQPLGVRLDSGDLAFLSIQTAKMLDEAGFDEVKIVLSNQLDELVIWQIRAQIHEEAWRYGVDPEALQKRLVYGVGTRLITSAGQAVLDGVYKLVAVEDNGQWMPAIKVSETEEKTLNPGEKQLWRLYDRRGKATADLLALKDEQPMHSEYIRLRHPTDQERGRKLATADISDVETVLVDVMREGSVVCDFPPIDELRKRRDKDIDRLDPGVKRFINPHVYHVSLSQKLWELKQNLIAKTRANGAGT